MKKIVTFGEVLMRLSPPNHLRFQQATAYDLHYAGAEFNTAISLSLLGMPVSFVTRLPDNDLSNCVIQQLSRFKVDTEKIVFGGKRIGLYYLESGAVLRGSKVIYDREHTSIAEIEAGMIDWGDVLKDAAWFHFSGITAAISQAAADETLRAVKTARSLGLQVSVDLNYRSKLWKYGKQPSEVMPEILEYCTVVIGDPGTTKLYFDIATDLPDGEERYHFVMKAMKHKFPGVENFIFSYRGLSNASNNSFGAYLYDGHQFYKSTEYNMPGMIDRVGGGDALMAGLIYGLLNYDDRSDSLNFGVAASVLKSSIHGDTNFVSVAEVVDVMNGNTTGRISR
ncbi:MAG: sugar kinase [Ferruginibacter sp.]